MVTALGSLGTTGLGAPHTFHLEGTRQALAKIFHRFQLILQEQGIKRPSYVTDTKQRVRGFSEEQWSWIKSWLLGSATLVFNGSISPFCFFLPSSLLHRTLPSYHGLHSLACHLLLRSCVPQTDQSLRGFLQNALASLPCATCARFPSSDWTSHRGPVDTLPAKPGFSSFTSFLLSSLLFFTT